jgi:hypothetical protein
LRAGGGDRAGYDSSDPAPLAAYDQASYFDCPGGSALDILIRGDRVFLTGKDASGGWVQVRHPFDASGRVWMHAAHVTADAVVDLPVVPCDTPVESTTSTSAPTDDSTTTSSLVASAPTTSVQGTTPATVQGTTPATTTSTPQAPDSTAPVASSPGRSPDTIYDSSTPSANCPKTSTLTVTATDNVGVTSVTGTFSGLGGSPTAFSNAGGNSWAATFGPFSGLAAGYNSTITITIVARDAAGNTSNAVQTSVSVQGAGNCLI